MAPLRVATVAGDAAQETAVAGALGQRPDVDLVMRCVDRIETLAVIQGGGIDGLIAVGAPDWLDHEITDEAVRAGARLVAVGLREPAPSVFMQPGWSRVSWDAGINEVVRRCGDSKAVAPPPPPPALQPSAPKGTVVAVWGPKGAPGRTTLSLELGRELASVDRSTLVVDADPYGGDLLQTAGIVDDIPTVVWAAQMAGRQQLDAGRVVTSLRRVGDSGAIVLPGLPRGDLWAEISAYGWRQLIGVARALFTYTVCDVGFCLEAEDLGYGDSQAGRNFMTRSTLQMADRIVAVCRADPVGVKNFIWTYEDLTSLVDPEKVTIVANRVPTGQERPLGDVLRRHVGKRPIAYLPSLAETKVKRRARSEGRLLGVGTRTVAASLGVPVKARGVLTALSGRS